MGEVDPAFVQDPEHRPKLWVNEAEGIPLIDLSAINSEDDPEAIEEVVREIGSACKEWGFFQVINHGVPLETHQKVEAEARKFFGLPLEEKRKVRRDGWSALGYYDTELTKNVRDWKQVFDFAVDVPTFVPASPDPDDNNLMQWTNQWPQYPPQFRFSGYFKEQTSFIRLNHYPPCPSPQLALGMGRHKDSGALTVVAQDDVGGLEVKRKSDGEWIRVKPIPNAFVINVGDNIQVWSNDKYESVEHRVMANSEKERFSIPFFLNPAHYTVVEPLQELIANEQNPPKFRPYNWGKFITHRKLSSSKKLNVENIQIYQFKIHE